MSEGGPTFDEVEQKRLALRTLRYTRKPTVGGRVKAVEALHAELVNHAILYESDHLQDQRDAVSASLLAIVKFLETQGFGSATVAPIMRPVIALVERENNSLDLLFSERARASRPKTTLTQHQRVGIMAALSDIWLEDHCNVDGKLPDKLRAAKTRLRGRWFTDVTAKDLKAAREIVSQEGKDHPSVMHAAMVRKWYDLLVPQHGKAVAFSTLLDFLNDAKLTFGLGEGGISKTPPVSPSGGG